MPTLYLNAPQFLHLTGGDVAALAAFYDLMDLPEKSLNERHVQSTPLSISAVNSMFDDVDRSLELMWIYVSVQPDDKD